MPFAGGILIMGGRGNSDAAVHPNRMMFYDPVRETQVPSCSVLHQFTSSGSSIEKGGHARGFSGLTMDHQLCIDSFCKHHVHF